MSVPRIVMDCERDSIDPSTKQEAAQLIVAAILEAGYPARVATGEDGEPFIQHQAPDEVFRKAQYLVVVKQGLPYREVEDADD